MISLRITRYYELRIVCQLLINLTPPNLLFKKEEESPLFYEREGRGELYSFVIGSKLYSDSYLPLESNI